jgi:hypothetical protein
LQPASSASEIRDCDGTVAAFDDTTFEEVWKFNVGSGITTPPMSFEANGEQYVAIATGASISSRARLINTPELKDSSSKGRSDPFAGASQRDFRCYRIIRPCPHGGNFLAVPKFTRWCVKNMTQYINGKLIYQRRKVICPTI